MATSCRSRSPRWDPDTPHVSSVTSHGVGGWSDERIVVIPCAGVRVRSVPGKVALYVKPLVCRCQWGDLPLVAGVGAMGGPR